MSYLNFNAPNLISTAAPPQTPLGAYSAPQTPWLHFRGLTFTEKAEEKKTREGEEKKNKRR